jgi:hypothetical protein
MSTWKKTAVEMPPLDECQHQMSVPVLVLWFKKGKLANGETGYFPQICVSPMKHSRYSEIFWVNLVHDDGSFVGDYETLWMPIPGNFQEDVGINYDKECPLEVWNRGITEETSYEIHKSIDIAWQAKMDAKGL